MLQTNTYMSLTATKYGKVDSMPTRGETIVGEGEDERVLHVRGHTGSEFEGGVLHQRTAEQREAAQDRREEGGAFSPQRARPGGTPGTANAGGENSAAGAGSPYSTRASPSASPRDERSVIDNYNSGPAAPYNSWALLVKEE